MIDEFYSSSDKRVSEDEGCFIPFWMHFTSTSGAKAEWRHSEGRAEASCVPTFYYYTSKAQKQGATFEKKKWHMMTITITISMSRCSHPISQIVRQTQ